MAKNSAGTEIGGSHREKEIVSGAASEYRRGVAGSVCTPWRARRVRRGRIVAVEIIEIPNRGDKAVINSEGEALSARRRRRAVWQCGAAASNGSRNYRGERNYRRNQQQQ